MAALPTVRCSARTSLGERSAIELGRREGSGYGCRCLKRLAGERGSPQARRRSSRARIDALTLGDQRLRRSLTSGIEPPWVDPSPCSDNTAWPSGLLAHIRKTPHVIRTRASSTS